MKEYSDPVDAAIKATKRDSTLRRRLWQWMDANSASNDGLVIQGELRRWLDSPINKEPDTIQYLYDYAYAYVILRDLTELPIVIPEADYPAWRKRLQEPTLDGSLDQMMGVLGGFLWLCGKRPDRVIPLMKRQIAEKLTHLKETLSLSLDKHYTPRILTKEEIEDGMEFQMGYEFRQLNEPFDLFDQLSYFALGLEDARLHCFDNQPDLGLPNAALFKALCDDIDLPALLSEIEGCEAGLKRIQRHLAKHQNGKLTTDDADAPDKAWWRHYRPNRRG